MVEVPKIPPDKLKAWMRMEAEHSKSPVTQKRIVTEHIQEHGMKYYPALIKMERNLKKK